MTRPVFSFDTETFLIRPGMGAPPMVCLQWALGTTKDAPVQINHATDPQLDNVVRYALESCTLNGHNVAYDMCVLAAWRPELLPLIFRAYEEDRVVCTKVRAQLHDIAHGVPPRAYGLADCVKRACGIELDKSDPWRLRYGTLYGTPVAEWPAEAIFYALKDAEAQHSLYHALPAAADECAQSRAAFWMRLMECWGIRTDPDRVKAYHAQTLEQSEKDRAVCVAAGLVRPDGSRDTKVAKERMAAAYAALGEKPPLTATGEVSCDEDACDGSGDEVLQAYQRFGSLKTILSRCERMYYGVEFPLQAQFQVLVDTGRTSCRMGEVKPGESPPSWGFQLQNLNR
jgi:DNA polymerase-1